MTKRILCLLMVLLLLPAAALAQYTTLSAGSTGEDVMLLQNRLRQMGLLSGAADGIYGKQTSAAVSAAQQLLASAGHMIEVTGEADPETQKWLFDAEAEAMLQTLSPGSTGDRVRQLQSRLIDLKFPLDSADGQYGSKTRTAVSRFQQTMNELGAADFEPNGIATPDVWQLLMSDLSRYGYVSPLDYDASHPLSLTSDMLYAQGCILLNAPTGEVLFEHQADEALYPASTTKIMTLLLALENMDPEAFVVIPESAADVAADSSLVPVYPGEEMQLKDLLYGLMIQSGNDAANAVAQLCSGSVDEFVRLMNQRAAELGMTGTHFANPHGYHSEDHYSTARDLSTLARYCLTSAPFCEIATCTRYTMQPTHRRDALVLQNKNEIFDPSSPYYIAGAAGVKSGYTSHAGFCYVGAAQRDGNTLIAVILNVPGRNRGWKDLEKLFEYGFAALQP